MSDAYDPTKDIYRSVGDSSFASAVTPSDDTDLSPHYPKMLYVGVGGDVACLPAGSTDETPVIFKNVPDGGYLLVRVRRVFVT